MKKKNNTKSIVDSFLLKKIGKKGFKNLANKDLINDGIIDSLDVFNLAAILEKKLNKKFNFADPKILGIFNKYKKIINL